jgi:hypothetical protein
MVDDTLDAVIIARDNDFGPFNLGRPFAQGSSGRPLGHCAAPRELRLERRLLLAQRSQDGFYLPGRQRAAQQLLRLNRLPDLL